MVCNGVLPIDQLREYTGPAQLVCQRIPKDLLNAIYTINIYMKGQDEPEFIRTIPTAIELLNAYAISRGYRTSGQGIPDQSRGARYILKDYVNVRLSVLYYLSL
jgi:large subunit GTPase 1